MAVAFVTNNASRRPEAIAATLQELGVVARPADVVTSAQGAAWLLTERLPPAARILTVGTSALADAVAAAGFRTVSAAGDHPQAVVMGYDPTMDYPRLAEAALAVRAGALFVATNTDNTMPSPRGLVPGNGALVAAVVTATGCEPLVAGKPQLPLHAAAVERTGARRPLVVGDRLDTDVEGAVAADTPALLVFSGVSTPADLLAAPPARRPAFLSVDLRGLLQAHPAVTVDNDGVATCRGWQARLRSDVVEVSGPDGGPVPDRDDERALDWLRAAVTVAWAAPQPPRGVRVDAPAPPLADTVTGW